ncbi:MAG: hypothetical protein RQ715_01265 [Methylococcales bacterium]|nr:hypothetical protein [Methylococcales bacterium]
MKKTKLMTAISGAVAVSSLMAVSAAQASENPFELKTVAGSTQLAQAEKGMEGKCSAGKCGEGKAAAEGKCSAGKCGEGKAAAEGKCSAGKCGEGKCGEGKCSGAM